MGWVVVSETSPANTIEFLLGRLDAKIDTLITSAVDHEKRISALEKWRIWLMAIAAAGGFAGGKIPLHM